MLSQGQSWILSFHGGAHMVNTGSANHLYEKFHRGELVNKGSANRIPILGFHVGTHMVKTGSANRIVSMKNSMELSSKILG